MNYIELCIKVCLTIHPRKHTSFRTCQAIHEGTPAKGSISPEQGEYKTSHPLLQLWKTATDTCPEETESDRYSGGGRTPG